MLAPAIREEYGLTLAQVGVVLAAEWVGTVATLMLWGLLADRAGERRVLVAGLSGCGAFLIAAGHADGFGTLVVLLALAGAAGSSVNAASGRAVMHWFAPEERGLALGVRQTAIPGGGLLATAAIPILERSGGLEAAFFFLGAFCFVGAVAGGVVLRGVESEEIEAHVPWTLRDRRLWRLCLGSGMYLIAQVAVVGFLVLFLHDERAFSIGEAAAVLVVIQVIVIGTRIGAGRWSDLLQSRLVPLRRIGLAVAVALAAVAVLVDGPIVLLLPAFVATGALSMSWNGLSLTAAAELAGRRRSGAAIGFQQSSLSLVGAVAPVAFAATVSATSWQAAFALAALAPLAGWLVLGPLERAPAR